MEELGVYPKADDKQVPKTERGSERPGGGLPQIEFAGRGLTDTIPPGRTLSIDEASERVMAASTEFAGIKELYHQRMQRILSAVEADPRIINRLLFKIWAENNRYDQHMARTGHEEAIRQLLGQISTLDRIGAGYGERMVQDRTLEMSCGTGAVMDLICKTLAARRLRKMRLVGNDPSEDMKNIAREKLRNSACSVGFTCEDMRSWNPQDPQTKLHPGSFGTVILSQTLHLIANAEALAEEQNGSCRLGGEDLHTLEKLKVIRNAFALLKNNGTFILIDEWPAMLSGPAEYTDPVEEAINFLFKRTFKPIERDQLREKVMKFIPEARFVAELKVPIWTENGTTHMMYAHIFRKDPHKASLSEQLLPAGAQYERARMQAVRRLIDAFQSIDGIVRESFSPIERCAAEWIRFMPLAQGSTFVYEEGAKIASASRNNFVILPRRINRSTPEERLRILRDSVNSLKVGGALLVIDEWKPTRGVAENGNPIRKSEFREEVMRAVSSDLIFSGAIRTTIRQGFSSGMYGYLYRKIR